MKTAITLILICFGIFPIISGESTYKKIDFDFKKLIVDNIKGTGHTIDVASLIQCLHFCDLIESFCAGVFYFESLKKCRVIKKCDYIKYIDIQAEGVFYSKRPMVTGSGYVHNPETDGCMTVIKADLNYGEADTMCKNENGTLVKVNTYKVNKAVKSLLFDKEVQWAWIHKNSIPEESFSNNWLDYNKKNFLPCIVPHRSHDPFSRYCFAINKKGQWKEFSCKHQTLNALCEI